MSLSWASVVLGNASIAAKNGRRRRFTRSNLEPIPAESSSSGLGAFACASWAGETPAVRKRMSSSQADAGAEGLVAHRGVLAQKIVTGPRAQIHQAAHR